MRQKRNQGYTLLELGVVVTIIGIVAGGIFVTQTLIRSAHLSRLLSEYDTYLKAMSEFQTKFLSYPGDMNNAETMWGTDPGGCPNTASNTVLKTGTCNGNGDGKIGDSTTAGVLSNSSEWYRAWQQLSDAGFLDQQYTGAPGPLNVAETVPGVNAPASSISGAGWTIHYFQMTTASNDLWIDQYSHMLDYGMKVDGGRTTGAALTSAEALALDSKVDDGKPGTGNIRAWRTAYLPGCTINDTTQLLQIYNPAGTSNACSLSFLLGF